MTVQVAPEAEVMREVTHLLLQYLPPTKVARFWASWQIGEGNYLDWRDEAFAEETVESLYPAILAYQQDPPQTS